jgi:hypothetical protein
MFFEFQNFFSPTKIKSFPRDAVYWSKMTVLYNPIAINVSVLQDFFFYILTFSWLLSFKIMNVKFELNIFMSVNNGKSKLLGLS